MALSNRCHLTAHLKRFEQPPSNPTPGMPGRCSQRMACGGIIPDVSSACVTGLVQPVMGDGFGQDQAGGARTEVKGAGSALGGTRRSTAALSQHAARPGPHDQRAPARYSG